MVGSFTPEVVGESVMATVGVSINVGCDVVGVKPTIGC